MRIVCLSENTSEKNLLTEHGLSLYLETRKHKILFDMGQSGIFLRNAQNMGVDLSAVDLAVISHGHYDHGGGLEVFLSVNDHAPVYMNEAALERHCVLPDRDIGLEPKLKGHPRILLTGDEMTLD
ncbi:MAG: MBL fold metallo-hydrolase, partial [Eubacteriales bacterium]|nr:MBL fold metallo-hydrolase [Eubacteriales bacterium]